MIRALRPGDVLSLSGLRAQAALFEVTTHTWPKVQPESGHLSPIGLLVQSLTRPVDRRRTWVSYQDGAIAGVVFGRSRAGGLVWDVHHLYAWDDRDACALLEFLCAQAAKAGARRVFMETLAGRRGSEIGRRTGFERYSASQLFYLPAHTPRPSGQVLSARPRLRVDEQALFHLYNASVPPRVRVAEAMTYEEWAALHRGRQAWKPSLIGDRQQFVWEAGSWLAGWAELVYGRRSQYFEMLIHPDYEHTVDSMLPFALSQTSEKAPVYASVREHQAVLASAWHRLGFRAVSDVEIYARQLAVRIPQPKLVSAQVVSA